MFSPCNLLLCVSVDSITVRKGAIFRAFRLMNPIGFEKSIGFHHHKLPIRNISYMLSTALLIVHRLLSPCQHNIIMVGNNVTSQLILFSVTHSNRISDSGLYLKCQQGYFLKLPKNWIFRKNLVTILQQMVAIAINLIAASIFIAIYTQE